VGLPKEIVEKVASLAGLGLSEEETDALAGHLEEVLVYVERLNQADTDGVAPMTHVLDLENVLRDDLVEPSLDRAGALGNAPRHRDGLFRVPRVIDRED
jgi:aspartyl-tRNA(Asn)/glutamyl-tRNA(Gln) amidotransferase subunit C